LGVPQISFRISDELEEALDAFAAEKSVSRSVAFRTLIRAGLNIPAKRSAAEEAIALLSGKRKEIGATFAKAFQSALTGAVLNAFELEGEPDLSDYSDGGTDGL